MDRLTLKKGYRLRLTGHPSNEIIHLPDPPQVAVLPERISHIKPRLHVAEGDRVRIGSVLFEDKRRPRIRFASPGGGMVRRIQLGPRRVVQAIVIEREETDETHVSFPPICADELNHQDRDTLVARILEGGLWWIFRELPFRDMPDPDAVPPLILVGLDAKEPFLPDPQVYLQGQAQMFTFGLKVLDILARGRLAVFTNAENQAVIAEGRTWLTHIVTGRYPSDDPGAVLYRIKTNPAENHAWYVAGQDVLLLARLLSEGRYPTRRVVSVGGDAAPAPRHYHVRMGAPLAQLADPRNVPQHARWIAGGLLRGYTTHAEDYLGLHETAVNIVSEGGRAEFLALFTPGWKKPSYSRTFLSKINPSPLIYTCDMHGDQRACIACMHCADVCPVDMLPHMVYKAVLAEEVEEYLQLGLLDCVECGLCAYVCPAKIELSQTFIAAKAAYGREQARKSN